MLICFNVFDSIQLIVFFFDLGALLSSNRDIDNNDNWVYDIQGFFFSLVFFFFFFFFLKLNRDGLSDSK